MTEQETTKLVETEQRAQSNSHRIDRLEEELKDIKSEQKAIYKIASSVELIAQRVSHIEEKVDDTNKKVDAQIEAWRDTERKLSEKVSDAKSEPLKKTYNNVNTIRVAIITAFCSILVSGLVGAIIAYIK